jgi:phosphatidylserine/phosphatidylglycerophosphate/cardiolipin synthase-like enzyme
MFPWNTMEDPAKTDIRWANIEAFKRVKSTVFPTNPKSRPGTIVFMPPTHNTVDVLTYLINASRKMDLQMYGWDHAGLQKVIVDKKLAKPEWDAKVLINRNGYMDGGSTYEMVRAAPSLLGSEWFILGTGEGDPNGRYPGRIMHRKAAIFDDCWFLHGSTNFEPSSNEYQANTMSITYDPELCAEMQALFNRTRNYNINRGPSWYRIPK